MDYYEEVKGLGRGGKRIMMRRDWIRQIKDRNAPASKYQRKTKNQNKRRYQQSKWVSLRQTGF